MIKINNSGGEKLTFWPWTPYPGWPIGAGGCVVALRIAGSCGKRSFGKSQTFKSQISVPRKMMYSE